MKCLEQLELSNPKKTILLLLLLSLFYTSYPASINLKEFATVQTEKIYLKDIATIKTKNTEFKQFLERIPIDKAPPPQKTKVITPQKVITTLKYYHLDTTTIKITGNKTIVASAQREIPQQQIKKEITTFLKNSYPKIKINSIHLPPTKIYTPKNYQTQIQIRKKTKNYIYIDYTITYSNKKTKIPISVKYSQTKKIIIAKHQIPKGHKITEEDLKTVEMSNVRDEFIENIEQAVGKIAKRKIPKDSPIKEYDLKPDFIIKKKDRVKIIYDSGTIRVELTGIALENGEKGKTIKIKNLSSGKKIKCKIIDQKTVLYIGK
ncbi:MAG: flagellar basal body P-ring formation protein FlgA [Aquificae bacterium]|nr:flagellar basal body P-ring formation protein FlgA [Aquificota bacterium]